MSLCLGPYALDHIVTGDARALAAPIPEASVDLVLTDPPYGIGFQFGHGYRDTPGASLEFFRWIVSESTRVVKPGGLIFVFQAMPRLRETWALCPADSRIFAACKTFGQVYRNNRVQYRFDPVIFWQKPGGSSEGNGRDWHVGNTSNTNGRGLGEAGFHRCPKPLDTMRYLIANFSAAQALVLDWCMGSGTTAVAATLEGRHYLGFELDPEIARQAQARVDQLPPRLPFLLPDQLTLEGLA